MRQNMAKNSLLTKQTIRYYWRHARAHKGLLIGAIIVVPLANLCLYYLPQLVVSDMLQRASVGEFTPGALWDSFGSSLILYAALLMLGGIALWRLGVFLIWSLQMRGLQAIHQEVFDHLLAMSADFHANRFGGTLVSQTNKFAFAFVRIFGTTIYELYTLFLAFVLAVIILGPRVPWIAVALLSFSFIFMFIATLATKPVRKLRAIQSKAESEQTGLLADAVSNILAIKSFAAGSHETKRYRGATQATRKAEQNVLMASIKRDTIFSTSTTTIGIASVSMTMAAIVLYNANIGTAFLVLTYTSMIGMRLWDFAQSILREYNHSFGDARDMMEILAIEPEVKDPLEPEKVRIKEGAINFQNMNFTHPDSRNDETLFVNLNLDIKAGEKIGLVGHSGGGKTTLTKLLLRFHDIDGGEILIDGQNIAHITQDDLRRNIAYVPQEPLLFHRSIRENIAYGQPNATEKQVIAAAEKAYAHEFIKKLPQGYETLVGERGVKLSGGQRQRIAIARAILKDAPILLLDEATSALDSESEKLIQAALWELMKNRTAIVIAHRLSTVQRMDRIVVLENGKIAEEGTHNELLSKKGTYAKLWGHQSGGFLEDNPS
jgi:ATP-binding cassette subfamily B protein